MSVFSKASVIIGGITLIVGLIDSLVDKAETWEDKVANFESEIESNDKKIAEYDAEITELESLQTALVNAKGNKVELAKIYDDLNDKIFVSTGLINGETKAWESANSAIKVQIAEAKRLRQEALESNIESYAGIFGEQSILRENFLGIDVAAPDVSGDTLREYAKNISTLFSGESVSPQAAATDLKNFADGLLNGEANLFNAVFKANPLEYKSIISDFSSGKITADEAKNKFEEFVRDYLGLSESEWETYWNDQVNTAYNALSIAIEDYEGYGGELFIKQLINNAVRSGYDLGEINDIIDVFNSDELSNIISNFQESLLDPSVDSEVAAQGIRDYFSGIKEQFPYIADYINHYEDVIISSYSELNNSINAASQTLYNQIKGLSKDTEDSFEDIQKVISELDADEIEVVTKAIANGLMDDVDSLEALQDRIGILTELKLAVGGVAQGFSDATQARNKFQQAMEGIVEYDTNFQSYTDAYNTLLEEINKGAPNSRTAQTAVDYLLGDGASSKLTVDEIISYTNGKLKTLYGNSETYGIGLLEQLATIDREAYGIKNSWAKKNADGTYDFDIDISEVDEMADAFDTTEEGIWAMLEALQMLNGDIQFFDADSLLNYCNQLGLVSEMSGKTAIKADELEKYFDTLNIDVSSAADAMKALSDSGYILLDSTAPITDFCSQLSNLGIIAGNTADGFTVNIGSMVSSLQGLNYKNEDILTIIGNLENLKKQDGEVKINFTDGGSIETIKADLKNSFSEKNIVATVDLRGADPSVPIPANIESSVAIDTTEAEKSLGLLDDAIGYHRHAL